MYKVKIFKIRYIYKFIELIALLNNTRSEITPFQDPNWLLSLIKEYNSNLKLLLSSKCYFSIMYEDKLPIILFPFYVKKIGKKKGIFLLGSSGKSDYLDFYYDSKINSQNLHELFSFLSKYFKISNFELPLINEKSKTFGLIKEMKCDLNYSVTNSAGIKINDIESYNKNISKNLKQNLRTSYNRLANDNLQFKISFITKPVYSSLQIKLKKIYLKRFYEKNNYINHFKCKFLNGFDIYFYSLNKIASFKVVTLTIKNEISSYLFYFNDKNNYYISRIVLNSSYKFYSPGIILINEFIKNSLEQNQNKFIFVDFTNGIEPYKISFGSKINNVYKISFKI